MKRRVALTTQRIVLIFAIATFAAVPVIASEGNWKLDADHSTARILLGSNAVNIGVARIGGDVTLDTAEPTNSRFDLSIDPAERELITFRSRHASMRPDGKLEVSGDLTLSRVVREVYLNSGEDYHGPVYGEAHKQTVSREATFVLPISLRGKKAEITAEAKILGDKFPELFAAVNEVNWPPVILDKTCEMPQAGEDYAGAVCAGTLIEPDRRAVSLAQVGEDYHGFESIAPEGNLMTIVLKLRLTRENPELIASKLR